MVGENNTLRQPAFSCCRVALHAPHSKEGRRGAVVVCLVLLKINLATGQGCIPSIKIQLPIGSHLTHAAPACSRLAKSLA